MPQGISPNPLNKISEVYLSQISEHHKKDADGNTIPHEDELDEAKVDQGRSDYGKASIRNYRRMGPGHGEPGMFDPEGKRGKTIDKRREEHKARRGVKGAKVPAYKVEEVEVDEAMTSYEKARKAAARRAAEHGTGCAIRRRRRLDRQRHTAQSIRRRTGRIDSIECIW